MNALVTAFLLFPFIHFDDGFVGIRHQKYYFFVAIAAMALIAELLLLLTRISGEKGEKAEQKPLLKMLSFTDWSAIALALSCALSTLFSPYITLAFWGEMSLGSFSVGRNNGLFLILLYVAVYFMLSRLYRFREVVFAALAASCSIVYLPISIRSTCSRSSRTVSRVCIWSSSRPSATRICSRASSASRCPSAS